MPRRRHGTGTSNPIPSTVNSKLADVLSTAPVGPAVIDVLGAVVSSGGTVTVHVRDAGVRSVLPASSVARTEYVCEPSARPE